MNEKDIWLSAQAYIHRHGDNAVLKAAIHAHLLQEKGDIEGNATLRRVIDAIVDLQDTTPGSVH